MKDKQITILENIKNFKAIKVTIILGWLLLLIFGITTNFNYQEVDLKFIDLFALNNNQSFNTLCIMRLFTSYFIHWDFLHLSSNIVGLWLMSSYERRVGFKRFLIVLTIGCIMGSLPVFFYQSPIVVAGISGGLYGLIAAYFMDNEFINSKDWFYSMLVFSAIFCLIYFDSEFNHSEYLSSKNYSIDHLGHLAGAIGAIIYCRLFRSRPRYPTS